MAQQTNVNNVSEKTLNSEKTFNNAWSQIQLTVKA